jgi:hypothetical protein
MLLSVARMPQYDTLKSMSTRILLAALQVGVDRIAAAIAQTGRGAVCPPRTATGIGAKPL